MRCSKKGCLSPLDAKIPLRSSNSPCSSLHATPLFADTQHVLSQHVKREQEIEQLLEGVERNLRHEGFDEGHGLGKGTRAVLYAQVNKNRAGEVVTDGMGLD